MNYKPELSKHLKTQCVIIQRLLQPASNEANGTSVHKLRMATRRVRSILWLLERSSQKLRFARLDSDLRRLGKALGSVRELDVAMLDADRYGIEPGPIDTRRVAANRQLKKALSLPRRTALLRRLSELRNSVRAQHSISLTSVRKKLRARMKHLKKKPIHGQARLHRLRISMKWTQYALEAMGSSVKPIRRLQCVLGDAHDLEFLHSTIGKSSKLRKKQYALNKKSARLVIPVLEFAAGQLKKSS